MLRYATYTPRKAHGSAVCNLYNCLIITPPTHIGKYITIPSLSTGLVAVYPASVVPYPQRCCDRVLPPKG